MTATRILLTICAMVLLTFVPAQAQTTSAPAAALQGMDVVSYFHAAGPVKGQPAFSHDFDGARYLFSSAQNKAAFIADPERYLPQFSGLCAIGIALGKEFKGDANTWKIVDGKLYLFHSAPVRSKGESDPNTLARAHQNWVARK
ncbi:MAG: YHS domain-containing protein [Ideonella sp.]|nr:YHS domain-containing protein [Ideonella sp.]